MSETIELGDTVIDTITGFQGVAVARHTYLAGCTRISVLPKAKNGKMLDSATFDEPLLAIIRKGFGEAATEPMRQTGGPEKYSDEGRRLPK